MSLNSEERYNTSFEENIFQMVKNVICAYISTKRDRVLIPGMPNRVVRGTISSVANTFEDQFALLLNEFIHEENEILVDYPISLQNRKLKPDIVIVRNGELKMIIELKIDLGYEEVDWREERAKKLELICNHEVLTYKRYNPAIMDKEEKSSTIKIEPHTPVGTIILAYKNGGRKSRAILDEIDEHQCVNGMHVPYFILLNDKRHHPNNFLSEYDADAYIANLRVRNRDIISGWSRLESFFRKHLEFKLLRIKN